MKWNFQFLDFELVTLIVTFYFWLQVSNSRCNISFSNFELVTRKRKNKSLIFELANCSWYHDFFGNFVCWTKKISIRVVWFLSFTMYTIVLQIDRNFKSEIFFILPNCFLDHTDHTDDLKSFSKGCVWGWSSCKQTNSFIKFTFSSVETVLGHPELCLLFIEPVSLIFFNRHLTEE